MFLESDLPGNDRYLYAFRARMLLVMLLATNLPKIHFLEAEAL